MAEVTAGVRDDVIPDLSFLIARANAVSLEAASAALRPLGLRVRSYSVLALAASDDRPSQREIAEFLHLDPSQVVALVDELQERGLVLREPDPRDRRAKVVVATAAGRRLSDEAAIAAHAADERVLAGLDEVDRAVLRKLLRTVAFPDGS